MTDETDILPTTQSMQAILFIGHIGIGICYSGLSMMLWLSSFCESATLRVLTAPNSATISIVRDSGKLLAIARQTFYYANF